MGTLINATAIWESPRQGFEIMSMICFIVEWFHGRWSCRFLIPLFKLISNVDFDEKSIVLPCNAEKIGIKQALFFINSN
jgi:hypothetical protein